MEKGCGVEKSQRLRLLFQLVQVGSSAGGARAKALIAWNEETNEVRSGQMQLSPGYELAAMYMKDIGISYKEIEQFYRRMVFNCLAVNQDDHVKNISFIMDRTGKWTLSPAYFPLSRESVTIAGSF